MQEMAVDVIVVVCMYALVAGGAVGAMCGRIGMMRRGWTV